MIAKGSGVLLPLLLALTTKMLCPSCEAQTDVSSIIGNPPGSTQVPVRFGFVNLDGGNLHLEIPLYSTTERGQAPVTNSLIYDSTFWSGTPDYGPYPVQPGWGASGVHYGHEGAVGYSSTNVACNPSYTGSITQYGNVWTFTEYNSTQHTFTLSSPTYNNNCVNSSGQSQTSPGASSGSAYDDQHTGMFLDVTAAPLATVYFPDGSTTEETPNGNQFIITSPQDQYLDELGASLFPINTGSGCIQVPGIYDDAADYTPKPPVSCTQTIPAWDGSANKASSASYVYTSQYIPVCTHFFEPPAGTPDTAEFCGGLWVLQEVSLPDGSQYSFGYDESPTSNNNGTYTLTPGHYGRLTSLTLPTGGIISYSYNPQQCAGDTYQTCTWGGQPASITDGGGTTTISYTNNGIHEPTFYFPETVAYPARYASITPPSGSPGVPYTPVSLGSPTVDKTVYSSVSSGNTYIATIQDYSANTLVRTITRDHAVTPTTPATPPSYVKTAWSQSGVTHEIDYSYDATDSLVTQKTETMNGALLRTLMTQYIQDTSAIKYVSQYHMINYPSLIQLYDASNNLASSTQYSYDEYSSTYCMNTYPKTLGGIQMLTSFVGASGHDDARDVNYLARGNITTVSKQRSSDGYIYTYHSCYDTLGNVLQTTDARGATRYGYADNYFEHTCIPTTTATEAFATTITDALGHRSTNTYFSCMRVAEATKDPNDVLRNGPGTTLTYDVEQRPLCTNYADGGQSCRSYPNTNLITSSQLLISSQAPHMVNTSLDGYGRVIKQVDQSAGIETDTSYDPLGRVSTVSNPYASTSDTTYGVTTYIYDVLGRVTVQSNPDYSTELWCYDNLSSAASPNNCSVNKSKQTTPSWSDFTDAKGNHWQRTFDAAGRLTGVLEPNTSNVPALETDYTYDALNDLLKVAQNGVSGEAARIRSFTYDFLSRLLSANNPETGVVCYGISATAGCNNTADGYDGNSNLTGKTDARGITTTYAYDALNRLTSKTYSDSTPPATWSYDQASVSICGSSASLTITNGLGRLTSEQAGSGSSAWCAARSYDAVGRPSQINLQFGPPSSSATAVQQFQYDLAGDMTAFGSGNWQTFNYTYNSAGQVTGMTVGGAVSNPEQTLVSGVTYDSLGRIYTANYPFSAQEQIYRDNRGRVTGDKLEPFAGGSALFGWHASYDTVGNVTSINDNYSMGNWSYSFDNMNRLSTASGSLPWANWDNSWGTQVADTACQYTYDSFGDRTSVAPDGSGKSCFNEGFSYTGNRIANSSYNYDASGNLISDGVDTYSYDGEGRLQAVAGSGISASYTYSPEGDRVTSTVNGVYNAYGRDLQGRVVWQGLGQGLPQQIYLKDRHFGSLTTNADANHTLDSVVYSMLDEVGTERIQFSGSGSVLANFTSLPFGDNLQTLAGSDAGGPIHYTGKERDTESSLDYFGARYYSSNMGRFMSPDPSGLNYADINNPQSFNLYSYALNNPLKFVDPTGLYCDYSDHNDPASGFDQSQFDYNSTSGECGTNGGQWVNDAYTQNGADIAGRPQYAVTAIGTPPAPGTDLDYDTRVAYDTQWLQAQNPSQTGDPSLTLAIAVMSQGIPKVCAVGVTATLRKNSVGVSASGSNVGATVNRQSTSGYTPQSSGVDMRSASPLFKSVPVGVYLSPGDPSGNSVSSVSVDATVKKVGVTAYVNLGTYTPNLSDPQNCP